MTRVAPLLVSLGGVVSVWGSFEAWGVCGNEPCEGPGGQLPHLFIRSGVAFGFGVATALVGFLLVLLGVASAWRRGSSLIRGAALALVVLELAVIGAHIARAYVFPEYKVYGPETGLVVVVAGAVLSGVAAWRLPHHGSH